jgi:dienelactone hydrolase
LTVARPTAAARGGALIAAAVLAGLGAPAAARAAETPCMTEAVSPLPAPPVTAEAINGRPTLRYLPPHPKGIVYFFHGSGGSEAFARRIHSQRVIAALIAAGYGYLAAPSLDREVKRWDLTSLDPAANADVAYMLAVHKALIAKGEITAATPVFTTGMSNGGGFANLFAAAARAQGLPVKAVADYMGPFPAAMRGADPKALAPTLLVLSHNDGLVSAEQTGAIAARLRAAGARIEAHVNEEHRTCAATFTLVPGLDAAQREELAAKVLPAAGLADPAGRRLAYRDKPVIDRAAMADLLSRLPQGPQARAISDELLIAWAGHQMRSDYAARQVAFFDQALAGP